MSAEKEIVNYWYNKCGFFTINNIKIGNRDIGILAIKLLKDKSYEVRHVEVSCSISSNVLERNIKGYIKKLVDDKFESKEVKREINRILVNYPKISEIKKVLILSNIPRARKKEIKENFKDKDIKIIEFKKILGKVIEELDTQYYKNDVIRSLQLVKFLLLSKASSFPLLSETLSSRGKEEFLNAVLGNEGVIKKLKKADEEVLADILKYASVKNPKKLAQLIQDSILNRRTRKPFLDALLEIQGVRKEIKKELIRKEKSLKDFF